MEGAQSVVHVDEVRATALWQAVADGSVEAYRAQNSQDELPDAPR